MSSSDESFRSYVNFHPSPETAKSYKEALENDVPPLLEDEVVASQCDKVMLYSDDNRGFLGKLYCTNFRISFVPLSQGEDVDVRRSKILNDKHDIALSCIEEVTYSTAAESKRFRVLVSPLSGLETVSKVKIYCKDFRVLTLDFQHSQFAVQLTNTIFHFAFPSKLENLFMCKASPERHMFFPERFPTFNNKVDWERELQRTGAGVHGWRITQFNSKFRQVESYPEWLVVPQSVVDHVLEDWIGNWTGRRVPIWCWASPTGCCLLRSSELNSFTKLTEYQWAKFEEAVSACHPSQFLPLIVDVSALNRQRIMSGFSALRKLCAVESARQFWIDSDSQCLSILNESQWLNIVSRCLEFSSEVVSSIDKERRSVVVKESEGCDVSCVVSCLCQLCLDPFYRTIDGFSMLIQKEWIALGHPFALRIHGLNQGGRQIDQMSPVFLLFLDCVAQLLNRYPGEFQFSQYYLIALWDLVLTGMTSTFSSNSLKETEQNELGCSAWPLDQYYTSQFSAMFLNPLYTSRRLVAKVLDRRIGVIRPGHVLDPPFHVAELDFWVECFLRWTPQGQTQRGGSIQTHLRVDLLASEISGLLTDKSRLKANYECRVHSPTFRKRPSVSYKSEEITSAFPYSNEAVPIPPEYYSLPQEMQQQSWRTSLQIATSTKPVSAGDVNFNWPLRNSAPSEFKSGNSRTKVPAPDQLSKLDSMLRQKAIRKAPPPPPNIKNTEKIRTVV